MAFVDTFRENRSEDILLTSVGALSKGFQSVLVTVLVLTEMTIMHLHTLQEMKKERIWKESSYR